MNKFIKRLLNKVRTKFNFLKPQMVYGFKRFDGKFLKNTRIGNTTYIEHPENLLIENNVFISHYNLLDASGTITIREGCQITSFISILTHSSHMSIRLYGKEYVNFTDLIGYIKGSVYIGEYTFIGPHSVIMPNTKIGKGSIISAYSYVQGEFPDFAILAGNPAKVVGDTRTLDERFLFKYPELYDHYNEWAK